MEAPAELNLLSSGGILGFDWNKVECTRFTCFGADNDHMTLPNNIRGKENTYSFLFLYRIAICDHFLSHANKLAVQL